ncbi:Pyridoxamine 5'-phosphate oxidase [Gimesia panareensis]|uniref:Pyridoxamine 5'-phosphate oxidase n=1 Tax=Gimesia panareensis TaxID=2527978 RepID=A0A517QB14_9PLAN|nr:pyridoxamine 5'-phosphate oxidase family protein [Gimesia panareensis]QDT28814.1 Pyridoxamine 5'-phosphate oxidase [Gimesia panareensis]
MNQQEQKQQDRQQSIRTLRELIGDIQTCMLTTHSAEAGLRSRPMITARHEFDGELWLFTHADDPKVNEIHQNPVVNVVFAEPKDDRYISISGHAQLVRDQQKAELLWTEGLDEWFPTGPSDPNLVLISVHVNEAEYWDANVKHFSDAVQALFFSSTAPRHDKLEWSQTES